MSHPVPRFPRGVVALALVAALFVLQADRAQAQIDPFWDHYKAYDVEPPLSHNVTITLIDQFQVTTHATQYLDWFANPVEKRHGTAVYPIHRPELHYTWWLLDPEVPFARDLIAINQFGEQFIRLDRSVYLLNPANKNTPPGVPLPIANHYKCYACTGQPVNAGVVLSDQFFTRPAQVFSPRFFCTPVEKRTPDGLIHPIVDPDQHYTVYDMDFGTQIWPISFADQFVTFAQVQLSFDRLLMVPTEKVIPTDARSSTWGRVKSQYR
jgi:hypothetical protein